MREPARWSQHTPATLELHRIVAQLAALEDLLPPGRGRCLVVYGRRALRLAVRAELFARERDYWRRRR